MRRILSCLVLCVASCTVYTVQVEELPPAETAAVRTPVKAHLADGSTVVYRTGVEVRERTVVGAGMRYDVGLAESTAVNAIALDSVLAMEVFRDRVKPGETAVMTTLGAATTVVAVGAVAVAIACAVDPKCFGSCPTVYYDSAGQAVLEAEGFSYSIAPLFEARDVDRLRAQPDSTGVVRLEVRNEALETHYINHIELLAVRHGPDELVLPDAAGRPLAVRALVPPLRATDRAGRDVGALLTSHDGVFFTTDTGTLARARVSDLDDHVELEFAAPPGADSVALVFRMRNSLLATVLLYDLMLGDRGPHALDYLAGQLEEIGHAVELGRFSQQELGLRVSVWKAGAWQPVARIPDSGPVAWKDVAALVPVTGTVVRVRLSFVADNWRIDRVAAAHWRRPADRAVPAARVVGSDGVPDSAAYASIASVDQHYLQTTAGQHFTVEFAAGRARADSADTYLIAWQGHYTEWIRRAWLERGREKAPFVPGRAALADAVDRWRSSRGDTERQFYATTVPVR